MGPFLMAGLAALGATVAIGLVASNTQPLRRPPTRGEANPRSLAIILYAFVTGNATLALVAALLALFNHHVTDHSAGLWTIAPGLVGVAVGLGQIVVQRNRLDRPSTLAGALMIMSIGVYGVAVTLLTSFMAAVTATPLQTWPFAILGLVSAAASLGIGLTGTRSIRAMANVDPLEAKRITSAQIARQAPIQLLGIAACGIGIYLVLMAR